jgi:hypothetical protein
MKNIIILEKTNADLEKEGYSRCSESKYNDYKKDSANYYTAVSDEGKYYYKKKEPPKKEEDKKEPPKKEEGKTTEKPKLTSCPNTPFTNSTESDAFRTWLLGKYPEYKTKDKPYNVNTPPQPKYINTTALRCAYKDKGKEYEEFLKGKTSETKQKTADEIKTDYEKIAKDYEIGKSLYMEQLCSPWEDENNFEKDFPGEENAMAKDFVDFIYIRNRFAQFKDDKTYRVGDPLKRALKKYSQCEKKHDDYVAENMTHKSPWLRDYVDYNVVWGQLEFIEIYKAWKSTLGLRKENTIIRKKLVEYKNMKTIKESITRKLSNKTKKVDVISENLYKVAGNFYNENYNDFFKKFEKLTENYKKSKLFLNEDSSESFNRAITKVFKGDEEKLKNEAIPFFMNKLGLEGEVKTQVENELNRKYNSDNIGDMFLDCWADIVVQAFKDNAKSDISEPSSVMDAIEKIMVSKIDSSEFDYQLKKEICKMLKPAQEEKQSKVQDLAKKLAQSIIDSSEA